MRIIGIRDLESKVLTLLRPLNYVAISDSDGVHIRNVNHPRTTFAIVRFNEDYTGLIIEEQGDGDKYRGELSGREYHDLLRNSRPILQEMARGLETIHPMPQEIVYKLNDLVYT